MTANLTSITPAAPQPWAYGGIPSGLPRTPGLRELGTSPTRDELTRSTSNAPKARVNSFWFEAENGDIIHGLTRKLLPHLIDPTNATFQVSQRKTGKRKEAKNSSNSLRFVLSRGLLLLDLLLSQRLRQQFLELLILEFILSLDELRLVP